MVVAMMLLSPLWATAQPGFPEPFPPVVERPEIPFFAPFSLRAAMTEWTAHRSADGSQPSGDEQHMMWLMNRARSNPQAEGAWLATTTHPDVAHGRSFFGVDLTALQAAFNSLSARPPAAFDIRLHDASELHSLDLIARDAQDHSGQVDKISASGFSWSSVRASVFSFTSSPLNGHAALNIDWGYGPGGMQSPPGHRIAIMDSGSPSLTSVGLALVPESSPGTSVGPLVFSGAYARGTGAEHNRFIVGTVWADADADGEFDPGEGLGGVTAMPSTGTYFAVTGDAGGYAFPVSSAGMVTITFAGAALGSATVSRTVSVGAESVLVDVVHTSGDPPPDDPPPPVPTAVLPIILDLLISD